MTAAEAMKGAKLHEARAEFLRVAGHPEWLVESVLEDAAASRASARRLVTEMARWAAFYRQSGVTPPPLD